MMIGLLWCLVACGAPAAAPAVAVPPPACPEVPRVIVPLAPGEVEVASPSTERLQPCTVPRWRAIGGEGAQAVRARLGDWLAHLGLPAAMCEDSIEVGAVELDYRDCANLRAVAAGTQDALGCVMQIRRAGMDPCLGQ